MANKLNLRIHPAIGMARVGNSKDYYLGPETMAGMPGEDGITGGLPIKPGTESTTVTSSDLRDANGLLKKQAARFKIYQYDDGDALTYPSGAGTEITIGSTVDGKKVADIAWTVHLANKKANCWEIDEAANLGILLYENGKTPPLRNPQFPPSDNAGDPNRLQKLIIDAGPRAIKASQKTTINFDNKTSASYWDTGSNEIKQLPDYPQQYPASGGDPGSYEPGSEPIDYLGEMLTEPNGRLLVLGGFGKACGFDNKGNPDPKAALNMDVDNNNWLDDTSDGPVTAALIFEDGSTMDIEGSAWAVITDPSYAPQTLNAISLWDDVYNTWLEKYDLQPEIYSDSKYQQDYSPHFPEQVFPVLSAAHFQMWNTNLPEKAINAHKNMYKMTENPPGFDVLSFIRDPNKPEQLTDTSPLMPLSLGDANKSFLTVTTTQHFMLRQWSAGKAVGAAPTPLGPGEFLDKAILVNCLGGRFSPGIDMTFIVRDPELYNKDWRNPAIGPFRINMKQLDYNTAEKGTPFLGVGYIPLRKDTPVEPGDICKFMAVPWHTDYNSCATHTPAPNPGGDITADNVYSGKVNTTLFWSWPAQRPVAVYTYDDLVNNGGNLPTQRYSVRGEGTTAVIQDDTGSFNTAAMNVGRYQDRRNMLTNWNRIGIIIQGPAIENYPDNYDKDLYLEVESDFDKDDSNLVEPWPNTVTNKVYPPNNE